MEGEPRERGKLLPLIAAFAAGLLVYYLPTAGLNPVAHQLFAVVIAVVILWITEAIPLPVTALLGPAACVLLGIGPAREVFNDFADPVIFLYLGSFFIAEAMLKHGLNRRIAFSILNLPWVGKSSTSLIVAFIGITGFLSMWISNTATTAMMLPIALAITSQVGENDSRHRNFRTVLLLSAAFASSVGGLATPVGTPPNLIGLGIIEKQLDVKIPFFQWMLFGLPLALVVLSLLAIYFTRIGKIEGSLAVKVTNLGRVTRAEWNVIFVFLLTVTLWVTPGIIALIFGADSPRYKSINAHFPEAIAAILGGCLLFILPLNRAFEPTLEWKDAVKIDWGTLLLFGGGLALGDLMFSTGLAKWIGEGIAGTLQADSTLTLVFAFTVVAVIVSETTSNAASATMVVPVAIAVSTAAGVNPLPVALAACLGASFGSMLPVSTPPNAIVYGSGQIPLRAMMRHGIFVDVIGVAAVVSLVTWVLPRIIS